MITMKQLLTECILAVAIVANFSVATVTDDLRDKAEQGHADAQSRLGRCYEHGDGVKVDMKEAVRWYEAAAAQGHADAQSRLGWCYEHGDGVKVDLRAAVRWYEAAAEKGHPGAQSNLGSCYERGVGVEKDVEEAVRWYEAAAEQGHRPAMTKLEKMGIPIPAKARGGRVR